MKFVESLEDEIHNEQFLAFIKDNGYETVVDLEDEEFKDLKIKRIFFKQTEIYPEETRIGGAENLDIQNEKFYWLFEIDERMVDYVAQLNTPQEWEEKLMISSAD